MVTGMGVVEQASNRVLNLLRYFNSLDGLP